ncbi:hypothetical protein BX600DRAFT_412924 [Xylariales sp. PMI_506]|nr:hypothetical protein BX600DRAFT_412924 [Xylariales sp. PMI_506]
MMLFRVGFVLSFAASAQHVTGATTDSAALFYSDLQPCPAVCEKGRELSDWTFYHDIDRLAVCDQPIMLDFNIYTALDDPCSDVTIRSCTVKTNLSMDDLSCYGCNDTASKSVISISRALQDYLRDDTHKSRKILFATFKGMLAGAYLGPSKFNEVKAADTLIPKFIANIKQSGIENRTALQICGGDRGSDQILGIAADPQGDFLSIQSIMKTWDSGKCITGDGTTDWDGDRDDTSREEHSRRSRLGVRADCQTTMVYAGDTCGTLANKCGVDAAAFTGFNSNTNSSTFCSSLSPGQQVCCSSGTLPDIKPKPSSNGTCATHTIESNEYCDLIASSNGITVQDLESFNTETWGWLGCTNVQVGTRICVSSGQPPLPAPVSNAVCGPIVPGTKEPTEGQSIADLNPCVLNACCNVWGQCGITAEFCTETVSETGNPGTSEPRANGCVQNCGTDLVNNGTAPAEFRKIGYFEAWNLDRPCLQMHVARIDQSYTHVHFAFAQISTDFKVSIAENLTTQWNAFKAGSVHYKKILSFGGWSFSTEYDTGAIFRQGVSAGSRALFADQVVQFLTANGIDGLDFDWEYPGATDIPGAPSGNKNDGANYLEFLKLVRAKLPSDKTLSIAVPASFWYLRGFPISEISSVVDYVVYMTYDLHGQWDAGSQWASDGCPRGSCLRSHVNYTETYSALSMLTKAGMPTDKIVVGVASYGRSFKMAQADCRGPTCKLSPDTSPAKAGRCTASSGILGNAEIQEIIDGGGDIAHWHDDTGSDSDFLVYESTEWVAYMSGETKNNRAQKYKSMNLGGTADWAIDLQEFLFLGSNPSNFDPDPTVDYDPPVCDASFESLDQVIQANPPIECGPVYVLPILQNMLRQAVTDFNAVLANGYDKYFGIYADYTASNAGGMMHDFLNEKGNDYFSCLIIEEITCCRSCYWTHGDNNPQCQHCTLEMCDKITSPWGVPSEYHNVSEPCPPDMSKRGIPPDLGRDYSDQSIFWSLRSDRSDQFWADVTAQVPAPKEKIVFQQTMPIVGGQDFDRGCAIEGVWSREFCQYHGWWFNVPAVVGLTTADIVNPKDSVAKALDSVTGLLPNLWVIEVELVAGQYNGSGEDVIDAAALPVFMVQAAIENMNEVVKMGQQIEEAEKKQFIATLLMALFFVLPVLGEGLAALGMGTLGRVFAGLGEVGNAGQGIYDAIQDPSSAPLAIFGLVLGGLGLRDIINVQKAAQIRRGMSPETMGSLGTSIKTKIDQVELVVNKNKLPRFCKAA